MKFNYIRILFIFFLLASAATGATAQSLRSGYFMEGATFRHQLNPAFMGERNYFSIPILGNFNAGVQGNIGVDDFVYKYNQNGYALTTFMNPMVGNDEFLSKLHDNNHLNADIRMTLLSFGFRGLGGFNTFEVGFRSNTSVNLPYGLFDFMKTGMSDAANTHYNIDDITVRSNNYVELALGHAHEVIKDRLTVGAKVKLLIGGANVDGYVKNMDVYMSQDQWRIEAEGEVNGSLKGGYFTTKAPNEKGQREVDGLDVESPGIGGYGVGIDLGAVYKMDDFVEGLTLSAAVLDLGFIKWNNGLKARMQNNYTFNGFQHPIAVDPEGDDDPGDIDNQIDQIGDDLEDFIKLYDEGTVNSRSTKLASTLNVGAEYVFPLYRKLTFGLLSTTHFNKPFTWTEARLSANVSPLRWLQASVNYSYGSFGSGFGWMLNFHPKGINFFVGMDHLITKVTPQYAPIGNANADISLGFNITWGK